MLTPDMWLLFVATAIGAVFIPGPGVLLTMAHSIQFGLAKSAGTIAGCLSANLFHQVLVTFGLGTIIASHSGTLEVLKYLGAGYLIYMGIRQFRSNALPLQVQAADRITKTSMKMFIEGFVVMSLNPRSFLFFLAFFPLFIDANKSLTLQFWVLGGTFALVGATSLTLYASFASVMRVFLADSSKRKLQTRSVGLLLILSGCWFSLANVTPQLS
ncbi:MAG: LysE family translocator [Sedimenticola sp.]